MSDGEQERGPRPLKPIRRFDVFAETKRLEALADGRPEDEAKGYGIWIAKVVAGRRGGRGAAGDGQPADGSRRRREVEREDARFRHAGDELQTDETFEREVVERMGRDFYERIFAPAIRQAVGSGQRYEQFRDTVRKGWSPAES